MFRTGWIRGQRGMDRLDSLLSTNVVSLSELLDEDDVLEPMKGFGQEGKAREGAVRLNVEVKAATISASWAAGKRISWTCALSRRERVVAFEGTL